MSVRREFDDDEEVEALRYDLETLASQARVDAVVTESFAAALERRLMSHAPCVAVNTGGAAAREAPAQLDKDDSNSSVVEDDDVSVEEAEPSVDEGGDNKSSVDEGDAVDENSENTLSSEEIDELSIDEIRDQSETIERLLARKSSLSTDDLNAIIRREKALLSQVRAMRKQLNV